MAFTTVRPMRMPPVVSGTVLFQNTAAGTSNGTPITFDATGDKIALVHRVPKTGTLTAIEFLTGTVSTTGATMRAAVEGIGTDGNPSGTVYVANAEGTVVVATSDDNVWKSVSINGGTGVTVTKGDLVATVIDVSSGTPNTISLAVGAATSMALGNFPFVTANTTGSYAKKTDSLALGVVWNYGGTYEYFYGANAAISTGLTAVGAADNERGLRFQVAAPIRITGVGAMLANAAAGANYRVKLYDSTPTLITNGELQPGADIDGDTFPSTSMDGYAEFIFPASIELSANTTYYATIYQTSANNLSLGQVGVTSSAYLAAMPGGSEFYLATRSGGTGAFTTSQTVVPLMYLLVDGIHDGTGGSGGGARIIGGTVVR